MFLPNEIPDFRRFQMNVRGQAVSRMRRFAVERSLPLSMPIAKFQNELSSRRPPSDRDCP